MPFNIGAPELIILLVLALIIFVPRKLPEVGQALGRTVREFRHASDQLDLSSDPSAARTTKATPVEPAEGDTSATTESRTAGS
jgi:sec-independent protein translocase protein TatA